MIVLMLFGYLSFFHPYKKLLKEGGMQNKSSIIIPFEKNFQKTIVEKVCDKINSIFLCSKLFFESRVLEKSSSFQKCFDEVRSLFNEENSLQEKYFKIKKILDKYNLSMKDVYFFGRFLKKIILLLL